MIPKIIHYCWFGGKPLPSLALKCIDSWKKYFPGYEIKQWDESNFDINIIPYTRESYKAGKYAFVSDYARYWILYNYGGLYFDTDVEVIKPFDDILKVGPFLGVEKTRIAITVNPGLGMGASKGMEFYARMLEIFESWQSETDSIKPLLITETSRLLKDLGWKMENKIQKCNDITIYPNDYFNPKDDYTGRIYLTVNSYSVHHYAKSWIDGYGPVRNWLSKRYHCLLETFEGLRDLG